MYKSIGIIPAAGKATRFGGLLKELLPAQDGQSLLAHACSRLRPYCDLIIVVTSKGKVQHHMEAVQGVLFVEQTKGNELLGAIQTAMAVQAERYYLTMPDTFIPGNAFQNMPKGKDLTMGMFLTYKPKRFGCLLNNSIADKQDLPTPIQAWGCLSWTGNVRPLFFSEQSLPDVLNGIIKKHGYETWQIGDYFDMATIGDYIEYLQNK